VLRLALDCDGVGSGVDQEKDGVAARGGAVLRAVCEITLGAESQPEFKALEEPPDAMLPLTRASKSTSPSPPFVEEVNAGTLPKDMKSSLLFVCPFEPARSCSFRDCSDSTRAERLLMSSMKAWNCCRLSRGPRLMLHNTGRTSIATKSASTTVPTCRRTLRDANATAGSLVLIPLMRGTIFSCIVYLSRAVDELCFFAFVAIPSRPSLPPGASLLPPHSTTKASSPRTLIPRLLVLLKTAAITGNSSFFIVEKSMTGSILGRLLSAASTILCVGDSMARWMIGRMSGNFQSVYR